MGPKGAVEIIFRKEIDLAADREQATEQKVTEYREKFANPYIAAERGFIDEVIVPSETRPKLIKALRFLENKVDSNPKKKHGNIPL
jgi:propionyl-CoA carboxylase beta chain